jgi:hypothetical protein
MKKSLLENVAGLGRVARGTDEGHIKEKDGKMAISSPLQRRKVGGGILLALLTLYDPTLMSSSIFTSTPSSITGSDDKSDGKHNHHESHSG